MTSLERFLTALDHRTPDRCPADLWATREVQQRLCAYFGMPDFAGVQDILESDLQSVYLEPLDRTVKRFPDGSYLNRNNVRVMAVKNGFCTYENFVEAPLAGCETAADLDAWDGWLDPDALDYDGFAAVAREYAGKRVLKLHTGGIFETAISLRGYEQFMMDLAMRPDLAQHIMDRITDYLIAVLRNLMKTPGGALVPVIYTYDDIASQNGLLCSPKMLERFVYPCHRRYNAVIKEYGKIILYHSCGSVRSQIGKLADLPIDILDPLQPAAKNMDFAAIKEEFGDRLTFHGGICIQDTLPHGTPDEVRQAVRRAVSVLGKNGGYILASAHYIQNDTPTENILAMYEPELRK